MTGLTHDERGYPAMSVECAGQEAGRTHLVDKIRDNAERIVRHSRRMCIEDAEVVVVAYGITARVARMGIEMARQQGVKVGFLRRS